MKTVAGYALLATMLALDPPPVVASPNIRPEAVIGAFREATGGSAWNGLDDCYEEGTHADGTIVYKTWFSLQRYGLRVESRRGDGSPRVMGFNGSASWQSNAAGGADVRRDQEGLREAVTTTYLSSNGFFFPDRFPATFRYLREASHADRTFDVLEITPEGGHALDYWFDRETRLLTRVVDRRQESAPITVEAGDYRQAGPISVAFSLNMISPDGSVVDRGVVTSLTCRPTDALLFDPPTTQSPN